MTVDKRTANGNAIIQAIGDRGSHMFKNMATGEYGRFVWSTFAGENVLFWVHEDQTRTSDLRRPEWSQNRKNVGEKRSVVIAIKGYILTGEPTKPVFGPWPDWYVGGNPWRYPPAHLREIRKLAQDMGITPRKEEE